MPGLSVSSAPAFTPIPPQYTPGSIVTVFLAVNLCSLQPEKVGYASPAYGSLIAPTPVIIPSVVMMLSAPDTPPTTPTDNAEILAVPPTVSAVAFLELS